MFSEHMIKDFDTSFVDQKANEHGLLGSARGSRESSRRESQELGLKSARDSSSREPAGSVDLFSPVKVVAKTHDQPPTSALKKSTSSDFSTPSS